MKINIASCVAVAMLALTSCASRQQVAANRVKTASTTAVTGATQAGNAAQIANTFGAWSTMKAGGSVSLNAGSSLSSSMQVRMERGKSIYISVRPLGVMEAGRLVITGDSILIIDKIHKRYILENVQLITNGLPIDVSTLQDIFLGRAFLLGEGTFNSAMASKVDYVNVDGTYMIRPKEQYKGFEYDFKFDRDRKIVSVEVIPATTSTKVTTYAVQYADVKRTIAGNIAHSVNVATKIKSSSFALGLEYGEVTWNEDVKIDAKIPSGYKQMSGESLLHMFSF